MASAIGGVFPYSYNWEYMWICNAQSIGIQVETCDDWNQGGTGSPWSKTVISDLFDMKIRLTATDSDSPPKQNSVIQTVDILCSTSC